MLESEKSCRTHSSTLACVSKRGPVHLGHGDGVRGTEAVYSYDLSIESVQRFRLLHYIASAEFVSDELQI